MNREFVLAIKEHRILGLLINGHFVTGNAKGEFFKINQTVVYEDILKDPNSYTDGAKSTIRLIDEYSDKNLIKTFSKNKKISPKDFYAGLTNEVIEQQIRPYIERRIIKCLAAAQTAKIRLFWRADNYDTLYADDQIKILPEPAETIFNFIRTATESRYFLSIKHRNNEMKLSGKAGYILCNQPCHLIFQGCLFIFNDIDGKKLTPFFKREYVTIPKSAEQKYFETFVLNSIEKYSVNATGFTIIEQKNNPALQLFLEKDWKEEYHFIPKFIYGNYSFLANSQNFTIVKLEQTQNDFIFKKLIRQKQFEEKSLKKLLAYSLKSDSEAGFKITGTYNKPINQQYATINWLAENAENLKADGFEVIQNLYSKHFSTSKAWLKFEAKNKNDWFDITAIVHFGEFEFPFYDLRINILEGIREFVLPNNEIALIPEEWFAQYKGLFILGKKEGKNIRVERYHFPVLQDNFMESASLVDLKKLNTELEGKITNGIQIPEQIKATLRPYQQDGYYWMHALHTNNFGGCLADDMGLGKTLQTITLLTKIYSGTINTSDNTKNSTKTIQQLNLFEQQTPETNSATANYLPSLIIMPTSLVHNWKNEFAKFAPHLNIMIYNGSERVKHRDSFNNYHVILTTYGILRNDVEILAHQNYKYIVLDESQYIKNPDSKAYQCLFALTSTHKLVLTGTPIENSLQDLWSQMNFINEGLLGNLNFFREQFITPIIRDKDETISNQLKNILKPFILRRTKNEVAKDLPDLTEQIMYCEMSEPQLAYYETEKSKIRNKILELVESGDKKNTAFFVFQGISKLRQIANHPQLILPEYTDTSGKYDEVIPELENIIAEGHKVLIFSSFVKHLKIFTEYFTNQNRKFSLLTGSTTNRDEVIRSFQDDPENQLFFISIKAGGVGLNLTSADYVFILDPWWNPAVENQAISRAHRIGQQKKVMVYRFITVNSIEEKIKKLQDEKSELAQIFIQSNNPFETLGSEKIIELLD